MAKTLYQIEDGAPVVVHDSVDAREYLATGRYSATPPAPLQVSLELAGTPVAASATAPAIPVPPAPAEARSGPKKAV